QVKAMIERQTKDYGWQFLYMGADQDAIEVGSSIGVAAANSMTYSRGRVATAMAATSRNIGRTRSAVAAGVPMREAASLIAFDDEQRAAAQE
ncbi:MAG: VWA domain-containing protein, partial [Dermatophilaceae bacterium]|nr:VWA domain-containing protein [Dermatophilaceae bacterium]